MISIFVQGLLLQASLILALGAQNIFVLDSGLRRERHLLVAFISSVCDTILIFIGVIGVATFFVQYPILKISLGAVGVAFLIYYGIIKLCEARKGSVVSQSSQNKMTAKQVVVTSIGFSLLNPHVYLDTIVLIGGYSSKFTNLEERIYFGAGASVFSTIWFFGLALLASFGNRLIKNTKVMRTVSLVSGLILIGLAIKLGSDVLGWISV